MSNIIVAVDVGTSKVCTIIGRIDKSDNLEILGEGIEVCSGVKKGIIVDIESTSNSIKSSIRKAEAAASLKVTSAYVNISAVHVDVISNRSFVGISNSNREVTVHDVQNVLSAARNISLPDDRQVIDIIPRQYIIDGYDEIFDPVGMVGVKLEADVDVISGKITSVQNIVKSLEKAGVRVDGLLVDGMANGEAILTPEEKEMGVILIDIGGGITEVSAYKNKRMIFTDSLVVGGDHVTNDVSIGLKIPYQEAEKVKREFNIALTSLIKNDQDITVSDINDNKKKTVKVSEIVEIVEARVYEIFSLTCDMLHDANVRGSFEAGIVIAGGGISYVDGGVQLAQEVFNMPARVASYKNIGIRKPEYATASGIIKYIAGSKKSRNMTNQVSTQKTTGTKNNKIIFKSFAKVFKKFF